MDALQSLLKGRAGFTWGSAEEESWKFATSEISFFPIGHLSLTGGSEGCDDKNLIIQVDASDHGCRAACWVVESDDHELKELLKLGKATCIDLAHRRFSSIETRYPAHDREGTGLFWAMQR